MKTDHCVHPNLEGLYGGFPRENSLLAKRDAHYVIITVDQEEWAISLENPDKNTVKCCQVCSINEGMRRASRSAVVV